MHVFYTANILNPIKIIEQPAETFFFINNRYEQKPCSEYNIF